MASQVIIIMLMMILLSGVSNAEECLDGLVLSEG